MTEDIVLLPPGSIEKWQRARIRLADTVGSRVFDAYCSQLKLEECSAEIVTLSHLHASAQRRLLADHYNQFFACLKEEWPELKSIRVVIRQLGKPFYPAAKRVSPEILVKAVPLAIENKKPAETALPAKKVSRAFMRKKNIKREKWRALQKELQVVDKILVAVADYYSLTYKEIVGVGHTHAFARPRQLIMYLAKQFTNCNNEELGKYLGDRDHSTVLHSIQRIEGLLANGDKLLQKDVAFFSEKLRVYATKPQGPS